VPHEEDVDESGDDAPQADTNQLDLLWFVEKLFGM
jgi:hypothetical protein